MNWRTLIVVVVIGVAIASAIRSLQGSPEAEFTAEEKAILERLEPILDTLVLQQEDLSTLPGHFEPCEGGDPYDLLFGSQGDSPDVEHIEVSRSSYDAPIAYSSFCDADSGGYVSSLVALPYDKEHLLFLRAVDQEMARAEEGPLRELVDVNSDDLDPDEEVVDYRWIAAPELGDSRYAWEMTVDSRDTDQPFEMYDFTLRRGLLIGGVLVDVPSHATTEEEAFSVARAFDDRIAAKLKSLAAEVQAP